MCLQFIEGGPIPSDYQTHQGDQWQEQVSDFIQRR